MTAHFRFETTIAIYIIDLFISEVASREYEQSAFLNRFHTMTAHFRFETTIAIYIIDLFISEVASREYEQSAWSINYSV